MFKKITKEQYERFNTIELKVVADVFKNNVDIAKTQQITTYLHTFKTVLTKDRITAMYKHRIQIKDLKSFTSLEQEYYIATNRYSDLYQTLNFTDLNEKPSFSVDENDFYETLNFNLFEYVSICNIENQSKFLGTKISDVGYQRAMSKLRECVKDRFNIDGDDLEAIINSDEFFAHVLNENYGIDLYNLFNPEKIKKIVKDAINRSRGAN